LKTASSCHAQPVPEQFLHRNYDQDEQYRLEFQQWVNQLWRDKDEELEALHRAFPPK